MAPDDNSGGRPAGPVVLRIKLRYDDLDAMVQRFAPNVGKAGLFLPTRSIQPVGTEVKFELRLANDAPVLVGLGRVKHVKPPDPANPRAAFGMAIELMRVSRDGREVIIRMIERRRAMGLADVSIPMPEDAEAARRAEVETQPRGETSGVVRDAMAQLASAGPEEALLAAKPASGPIAVAKPAAAAAQATTEPAVAQPTTKPAVAQPTTKPAVAQPTTKPAVAQPTTEAAVAEPTNESAVTKPASEPARSSSPLLTSPRAGNGSIARDDTSGRIAVPVLAPEKSRPRRPRVEELIDRAAELSARVVVVDDPDLDMHVDVDRVLTRARALAGGDMDVELAALREAAAAPVEISVEAASAELARQLGGKPIAKRERSARWETPPPVMLRHPLPEPGDPVVPPRVEPEPASDAAQDPPPGEQFSARTRAETEGDPAATIAAVVTAAVQAQAPAVPVTADTEVDDGTEEFERDDRTQTPTSETVASAFASSSVAAPENEHEGERPSRRLFGPADDVITEPASDSRLLIDDNADVSALERALEGAEDDEPDMLASGEYEIAEDTRFESTQIGGPVVAGYPEIPDQLAAQLDEQLAEAEAEAERELADGLAGDDEYGEPDEQEISELDVLAEADEDDEELLAAQGYPEQQPYAAEPAYAEQPHTHERGYAEQPFAAEPAYAEQPYTHERGHAEQPYAAEPYAEQPYAAEPYVEQPRVSERGYAEQPRAPERGYAEQPYAAEPYAEQPRAPEPAYAQQPYAPEAASDAFASRLDLGDDELPPDDEFDHEAAREFDREAAAEFDLQSARELLANAPAAIDDDPYRDAPVRERSRRPSSEPSSSYTFAEDFPNAGLQPHDRDDDDDGADEFDEPHSYAPAPVATRGPDPRLLKHGRATTATTEDLEDALAALDVDLDDIAGIQQRRARRGGPSGPRPLPGLPIERPNAVDPHPTGPQPVASRVGSPTGQQPVASRVGSPTGQQPVASRIGSPTGQQPVASRVGSPTGQHPVASRVGLPTGQQPVASRVGSPTGQQPAAPRPPRPTASHAKPPPIPAAARKPPTQQVPIMRPPTQQVPVVHTPAKRASTEDGILIDFDDDE